MTMTDSMSLKELLLGFMESIGSRIDKVDLQLSAVQQELRDANVRTAEITAHKATIERVQNKVDALERDKVEIQTIFKGLRLFLVSLLLPLVVGAALFIWQQDYLSKQQLRLIEAIADNKAATP